MVKITSQLKETIAKTIAEAERRTSAEIVLVTVPASDAYESHLLSYGFILGSLVDIGLWTKNIITDFPLLFGVQVSAIMLTLFIPPLRSLCVKLVPQRMLHHHAARRALEEFLIASRHVPAEKPVVLLYVSLAERYVHILHSRSVTQKIPNETWNAVVQEFTALMKNSDLQAACVAALQSIAKALEPQFPVK